MTLAEFQRAFNNFYTHLSTKDQSTLVDLTKTYLDRNITIEQWNSVCQNQLAIDSDNVSIVEFMLKFKDFVFDAIVDVKRAENEFKETTNELIVKVDTDVSNLTDRVNSELDSKLNKVSDSEHALLYGYDPNVIGNDFNPKYSAFPIEDGIVQRTSDGGILISQASNSDTSDENYATSIKYVKNAISETTDPMQTVLSEHTASLRDTSVNILNARNDIRALRKSYDTLVSRSDVIDVVGTKSDLDIYNTENIPNLSVIKVLKDETINNAESYYRYIKEPNIWQLIGSLGEAYTKGESDDIFATKGEVNGIRELAINNETRLDTVTGTANRAAQISSQNLMNLNQLAAAHNETQIIAGSAASRTRIDNDFIVENTFHKKTNFRNVIEVPELKVDIAPTIVETMPSIVLGGSTYKVTSNNNYPEKILNYGAPLITGNFKHSGGFRYESTTYEIYSNGLDILSGFININRHSRITNEGVLESNGRAVFTGETVLDRDPTEENHVVNKRYVDKLSPFQIKKDENGIYIENISPDSQVKQDDLGIYINI